MTRRQAGPWNQKNSDDLVNIIDQRLGKDKAIIHDIDMMVTAWRSLAVAHLGEEKYKELSKQSPSGDLATDFVNNRFEGMMMQQLAKSKIPHSGLEYMLRKGIGGSLLAGLADTNSGPKSDRDKDLEKLALRLYQPKAGTKVSGALLTAILDGASLGPCGIKSFAVTVAGDTALQCVNVEGKTFDQTVGKAMFDDEDAITSQRQKTKKVNPAHSEVVDMLNQSFDKKIKAGKKPAEKKPNLPIVLPVSTSSPHKSVVLPPTAYNTFRISKASIRSLPCPTRKAALILHGWKVRVRMNVSVCPLSSLPLLQR